MCGAMGVGPAGRRKRRSSGVSGTSTSYLRAVGGCASSNAIGTLAGLRLGHRYIRAPDWLATSPLWRAGLGWGDEWARGAVRITGYWKPQVADRLARQRHRCLN